MSRIRISHTEQICASTEEREYILIRNLKISLHPKVISVDIRKLEPISLALDNFYIFSCFIKIEKTLKKPLIFYIQIFDSYVVYT
jgi:hypothetical protein